MNKEIENKKKKFQVWKNYGTEGWAVKEFDDFTECVDYISSCASGVEMRITKLVEDQQYHSFKQKNYNK